MRRSKFLALPASLLVASIAIAGGNPFAGGKTIETAKGKPESPPPTVTKPSAPPPIPMSAPSPLGMGSTSTMTTQQPQAQTQKQSKWRLLGKIGEDQVALQGEGDEVILQRDGTYIDSCYVLYPEISCDDATITGMKTKKNAAMTMERLKTELEIEKTNSSRLRSQHASLEQTLKKHERTISAQAENIATLNKEKNELSDSASATQAKLKQKDTDLALIGELIKTKETLLKQLGGKIAAMTASTAIDRQTVTELKGAVVTLQNKLSEREKDVTTMTAKTKDQDAEIKRQAAIISAQTEKVIKHVSNIDQLEKREKELASKLAAAEESKKLLTAQIEELKNQPAKIVEKPVPVAMPEWMKGDYYDASIGGVTVGLRRTLSSAIIRVANKNWPSVSKTLSGNYSSEWEDGNYRYALVKQGSFSLASPTVKEAVN